MSERSVTEDRPRRLAARGGRRRRVDHVDPRHDDRQRRAADPLRRPLDAPVGSVQWVVTGYMLALAAVIPVTGWAARTDRYAPALPRSRSSSSRSARCSAGFAWSIDSLIVFRVLQGLGGGMLMPTGMIILARAAGPQQMGRIFSAIGVPMVLAPVFGPVARRPPRRARRLALDLLRQPPRRHRRRRARAALPPRRAAPRKQARSTGSALAPPLHSACRRSPTGSRRRERRRLRLAAGARSDRSSALLLTALFVVHSLRSTHPLLNVRLYANRAFAAASATTFCLGATLFGAMILLPLYFQIVRARVGRRRPACCSFRRASAPRSRCRSPDG